jgi:hypothetical protein
VGISEVIGAWLGLDDLPLKICGAWTLRFFEVESGERLAPGPGKIGQRRAPERMEQYFSAHFVFTTPDTCIKLASLQACPSQRIEKMRKKSMAVWPRTFCKISIYSLKLNFVKSLTFWGIIRKISYLLATHIRGQRNSTKGLVHKVFSRECPFKV